jgi:hypothetical protein
MELLPFYNAQTPPPPALGKLYQNNTSWCEYGCDEIWGLSWLPQILSDFCSCLWRCLATNVTFLLCYGYMKYLFILVEHWIFQDRHMNSHWSSPVTFSSIGESSSLYNILNPPSPLLGQNIILTTLSSNTLNIFSSLERHCCTSIQNNRHNDDDDHVDGMRLSLWNVATKGPISQVIYDYEEPRDIILTGENICPPELSSSSTSSHLAAKQEELAKDVINLDFRSIFVRT